MERPHFTDHDLPLTHEQLRLRETWMMEVGNWRGDHSVPSVGEHYRYMWKWDSTKAVVINARRDDPERADLELRTLLRYIDPLTGFMPNKIFATADKKTWRDYPEAWNFNNNKVGTSYSQPPLEAWAAMETYRSYGRSEREDEGLKFLADVYGMADEAAHEYTGLSGGYAYFINHRQNSPDDPLIGIVHPNETGRDSDEANKPWLLYSDKKGYDAKIEWLQMQKLGWDLGRLGRDPQKRRIDWIPEQVRRKYWVNDVMFNAMHASNLRYMANIAAILAEHSETAHSQDRYIADATQYMSVADAVEQEILDRMWNSQDGFFYNLDMNGNQIPVESVTGLFPLLLENISMEQIEGLVDKLEDPNWFATPYPIPTHAVRSAFYDPDSTGLKNKLTPQWSGRVWTDVNHILTEEGAVPRIESLLSDPNDFRRIRLAKRVLSNVVRVQTKTEEMMAKNLKSMEYYSPVSGEGTRVTDFMWTNIGLHFEKLDELRSRFDS